MYGSWKTIWISLPRLRRSRGRAGRARASRPHAVIVPAVGRPARRASARPSSCPSRTRRRSRASRRARRERRRRRPRRLAELLAQRRGRSRTGLRHRPTATHLRHRRRWPRSSRRGCSARGRRRAVERRAASRHASWAKRQRGANAQPAGASNAVTGRPGIAVSRCAVASMLGPRPASAAVYGCSGPSCSARCAVLDDPPGVHHRRAVADRRGEVEVVGDEQHRHAALAAQVVEDRHHLRLGGHVERGGRLVGEQQARLVSSAAAIITRCSMPPDSSCGYWRSRRSPSAIPTSAEQPHARAPRPRPADVPMVRSASVRKSPIVRTGLMWARGSWKTMRPRAR